MTAQVVLLMAGLGSRFTRAGYAGSKPLIRVDGVPMFERALRGLDALGAADLTVVVRRDQMEQERIAEQVHSLRPGARFVALAGISSGAAESALAAVPVLDPDRPVIVLDCDLEFSSEQYVAGVDRLRRREIDALLLTFPSEDARYSFVSTPDGVRVEAIAEKRVISSRAIAGAYGFASPARFGRAVQRLLADGPREGVAEAYMSEVVHALLVDGAAVDAVDVDCYASFGTPEELDAYVTGQSRGR